MGQYVMEHEQAILYFFMCVCMHLCVSMSQCVCVHVNMCAHICVCVHMYVCVGGGIRGPSRVGSLLPLCGSQKSNSGC